ncbi:hypothetical protein WA026_014148 [Henosepilachna vigintioctopunctata]|uniref:Uncharacterized protein n=1 Tax=Henosepilachna vigintioctopunctata TaxID=420089 RepID=A0AAW1TUC0_9CUCU
MMGKLLSRNAHTKELGNEILLSILTETNDPHMKQELVHIIKTVSSINNHKKMKVEEIYQVLQETRNSNRRHKNFAPPIKATSMQISVKPHAEVVFQKSPFSRTKVAGKETKHLKHANNKRNNSIPYVKVSRSPNKSCSKTLNKSENENRSEIYFYNVENSTSLSKSCKPILVSHQTKKNYPESIKRSCVYSQEKHLEQKPTNLNGSNPFDVECILSEIFHSVSLSGNEFHSIPSHQRMQINEISSEDLTNHKKIEPPMNIDMTEKNSSDDDFADQNFNDSFLNECEWTIERDLPPNILNEENYMKLSPMFEKVKGDERDLPSIYSRFVRKSKCASSIISDSGMRTNRKYRNSQPSNEMKYPFNETDSFSRGYILGDLVKDELVDDTFPEAADKQLEYDEIFLEAKATATLPLEINKNSSNVKRQKNKKKLNAKRSQYKTTQQEKSNSQKYYRKQSSAENIQPTNVEIGSSMSMNITPSHAITMILLTADKLKH